MIDDGEGTESTIGLIGCALLSVIEAIEHAGELRPESKFRDLALVMSLYLAFAENARAMFCWEEMTRSERVVGYAKKGGLDLKARGRHGMKAILEGLGDVAPIQKRKVGMWMWSANVRPRDIRECLISRLLMRFVTVERAQERACPWRRSRAPGRLRYHKVDAQTKGPGLLRWRRSTGRCAGERPQGGQSLL